MARVERPVWLSVRILAISESDRCDLGRDFEAVNCSLRAGMSWKFFLLGVRNWKIFQSDPLHVPLTVHLSLVL